jgi:hypothetical protein
MHGHIVWRIKGVAGPLGVILWARFLGLLAVI